MRTESRRAFTLFQLLVLLAMLALLFALFLPAIAQARLTAARLQSQNNMKQVGIGLHNYLTTTAVFPPGNDDKNFSGLAYTLPYLEQAGLFATIDFKKPMDDKANAAARKTALPVFLDPRDSVKSVTADFGPTNYLLSAGSKPSLNDNNGLFYQNSKVTIADITDGTSNTLMTGETLKGDGGVKATTVKRQHVLLKKDDLKGIKDEAGVKDWENSTHIAADRGASWMDGRFLQSTFTGTRALNDLKPDVNCGGAGGLSGLRSEDDNRNVLFADGSVRTVTTKVNLALWKQLADRADGQVLPAF